MIPISEMKAKVKALVEDLTGLKAYFDLVPNNIKTGVLITRQATEFSGRTVDGDAHLAHHGFEVLSSRFKVLKPVTLRRISWLMPLTGNIQRTSDSLW